MQQHIHEVTISETPLSSNTTKRNYADAYTLSDEEIQPSTIVPSPFHSETLFVIQNEESYMTGKPTYETIRIERRPQLSLTAPIANHGDSRGHLSLTSSIVCTPKSLDGHHALDETSTTRYNHQCITTIGQPTLHHETSQISTQLTPPEEKKVKYSSFFIKLFSFTNIFILMFIVQGLIGVGTAFILTNSSVNHVLEHSRQYQRLQLQVYFNSELQKFISQISSMTNHISKQMQRFNLNDNLAMIKMIDSIDTAYNSKIGAGAYRWARFDDFYFARQFNETVDGYVVRVYNPIVTNFKYYNVSKNQMSKAPTGSKMDVHEYLKGISVDPYYDGNSTYYPKKREYYLPYDKGNQSATDIMWSNSWANFNDEVVITLSIPVFSNYSMSFFKESNNSYLIQNMLHPKYISIPNGQLSKYPYLKSPQYLFGVLSIQFSWESASKTILNGSNYGTDLLKTNDAMEYSMIVDSKYNLIGKSNENKLLSTIHQVLKERNLLSLLSSPCGNMTSNITESEITSYGTVFFTLNSKNYGKLVTDAIEVEIAPICDKYGIDWFVVVGNYKSVVLIQPSQVPDFVVTFVLVFVLQAIFLVFSVVNIRLSFSAVKNQALSILKLGNEKQITSRNALVRMWNTFKSFSFFVDIREMKSKLSTIRNGLSTFSKYVPELVVKAFTERDGPFDKINLAQRNMTILFTELVGFSELSHGIHDDFLPCLMTNYFTIVSKAVKEEGGMITQFIGDRAVCVFNVYCLPLENHEIKACRAALKIMMNIENFNRIHLSDLQVRASITSDENILCGNTGSQSRMNVTVIGSSVPIAKALLFLNKHVGKKILIHEKTYQKVVENFVCNFVDYVCFEDCHFSVYSLESIFCLLTEEKEEIHNASFQVESALSKCDFSTIIDICKKYESKDESLKRMRKRAETLENDYSMWNSCDDFDCSFKLRVK